MKRYVPPYNEEYSQNYDERWPENKFWKEEVNFTSSLINQLLNNCSRWLDAGCGTGYYLKQFSHIYRTGFDLSETMLDIAKKNNSHTVLFKLHDISKEMNDWKNKWDLVTCTGQPWAYLENMRLIERVVKNLYDWTSDSGSCLLIPDDIQSAYGLSIRYNFFESDYSCQDNVLNALIWTYIDDEFNHKYLVYPLLDQWIRWFSKYFEEIHIEYKKFKTHVEPRTYIICKRKKKLPNNDRANIFIGNENLNDLGEKLGWNNLMNSTLFI